MLIRCLYCGREKDESEFSDEHVIPRRVGGNLTPVNPFKLRVCQRCNNICGFFVDGTFLKSWFTQNQIAMNAFRSLRLTNSTILPLTFLGRLNDHSYQSKICELWLGPTGDTIFHFHDPYPEEPDSSVIVGTPPHLQPHEFDSGFVFLFIRSNNPAWHPSIVLSLANQFKHSQLFLGNGQPPPGGPFSEIPSYLSELHAHLTTISRLPHNASFSITTHYADRFMAKVALGLGGLLLRNDFCASESANLLRRFLWTKDWQLRETIPIMGISFLGGEIQQMPTLSWPGGHTVLLKPSGNQLILFLRFFDQQQAIIAVSNNSQHWNGLIPDDGIVYVISPGLSTYVGPKTLPSFCAHQQGFHIDSDLRALTNSEISYPLPPFDI